MTRTALLAVPLLALALTGCMAGGTAGIGLHSTISSGPTERRAPTIRTEQVVFGAPLNRETLDWRIVPYAGVERAAALARLRAGALPPGVFAVARTPGGYVFVTADMVVWE